MSDNYRPLKIQTARPVPLHFQAAAKITLDELIQGGGGCLNGSQNLQSGFPQDFLCQNQMERLAWLLTTRL